MDKYLIEHCAPTLASIKSANLFNMDKKKHNTFREDVERLNKNLNDKGLFIRIIKESESRALIYVYRKSKLINDWKDERVKVLADKYGYNVSSIDESIDTLTERLKDYDEFPHEIGIFLGYPIGDVIGFIENKGKNCKCIGCWKVYCDECKAQSMFNRFEKCRAAYRKLWYSGKAVTQLAVAA